MRTQSFLVVVLLLASGCADQRDTAPSPSTAQPIFRYIDLGSLGRFELGDPFDNHARIAREVEPNTYRIRDGAFGGAESIEVTTDQGGVVRRIDFTYGPGYDWSDTLSNYTESLGPPTRSMDTAAIWNDAQTEFSLMRAEGTTYAARAEMRDVSSSS